MVIVFGQVASACTVVGERETRSGGVQAEGREGGSCSEKEGGGGGKILFVVSAAFHY